MLLTLDLATVLGYTVGAVADRGFKSGHYRLPSTGADIGAFAAAYDGWLDSHLSLTGVTEVVFEAPVLPRKTTLATVRKLSGLAWHTEWLCTNMGIKCYEAHLQSVKKAIGGHGRAQKSDMIRAVQSYGYDVTEENEADAIAVRLYTIMTRHQELAADFGLEMGLLGANAPNFTRNDERGKRLHLPQGKIMQLLGPEE